jgi:molybdopterin-guanine dinucleotide biosynthesis protein A
MAPTSITIAILAGGAASRLDGRDKGLEPLDGRPLIAWVLDAIRRMDSTGSASDPAPALLHGTGAGIASEGNSAQTERSSNWLIVANRHLDVYSGYAKTVSDHAPGFHGPLAGVASALAACTTPWLLTVPVDCPEPPHDLATRLLQAAQADAVDAVVAHDGERRQPLFAIYRCTLADSAANAVASGHGVWFWQEAIGARELDFSDRRRQFHNLNTPEEFAAYVDRDET